MGKVLHHKYVVRIYDKRTQKTRAYRGPYKTRAEAVKSAENAELYYRNQRNIAVSIRD